MPRIAQIRHYDGAEERIKRLGLQALMEETLSILQSFPLAVQDARNANSGASLRSMIDGAFQAAGGWSAKKSGGVDWTKCKLINGVSLFIGVEVQVSARSDLIIRDLVHIREEVEQGRLDIGVLVLPSKALSYRLTDRAPSFEDAERIVDEMRVSYLPLVLVAIEQDRYSDKPLPKKRTNLGRA